MDATQAQSQYAEAKRLYTAGRHAEALALLESVEAAHPNAKNILLAKAECLIALGDRLGAARTCEAVLARQEDERARRLLATCLSAPSDAPPLPTSAEPAAPSVLARKTRRLLISVPILLLLGAGAIAIAMEIERRQMNPGEIAPAFTEDEVEDASERHETARETLKETERIETEERFKAEQEIARDLPGFIIPEEEWNLDPATGAPAWRPGIYLQLPCPGTWFDPWQGPRTIDVYLPMAYATESKRLFPLLAITMTEFNSGFRGFETWAESNDVILVSVNSSCNECGTSSNREAQIAAYELLENGGLRMHPQLLFATGMSGGAQVAWLGAYNSPDLFAGVLMNAQGGFKNYPLAPHIRIAYVNGDKDSNARYVTEMTTFMRANGNEVRHEVVTGGHIEAPLEVRVQLMDWLLNGALSDLAATEPEGGSGEY